MREKLWNVFMETGSIDAFLDYNSFMTLGFPYGNLPFATPYVAPEAANEQIVED